MNTGSDMERRGLTRWLTTAQTIVALGIAATAHAQLTEARIQELIKQAADNAARSGDRLATNQTAQTQAAGQARPVVQLTLEDAVKFALDRNLDIAVQRLNPQVNDISIASIQSAYHPALTSTLATQSTVHLRTPRWQARISRGRRSPPVCQLGTGGSARMSPGGAVRTASC